MKILLALLLTIAFCDQALAQNNVLPPDDFIYHERQVTDEHRFQENVMSGHWGHHLGHLVRTATTGLWFVDDTGNDVYITPKARYYQLQHDGVWAWRADIMNPGQVQQNTATVAVGDSIYTYGIDIANGYLTENWIDTRTLSSEAHKIVKVEPNTNYIGAAVSPKGIRIIWWTNVVDGGGPCKWFYTFNDGQQWHPVITSAIEGANDFSYVVVTFANDSTFYAAGEAIGGLAPNWTYDLAVGKVVLGEAITGFIKLPGDNYTACDIWCNQLNGDLHLLGNGKGAKVNYYYKPSGGTWPDSFETITDPETIYRGTRFIDAHDGYLYLILSTPAGLKFKYLKKDQITDEIPFDALTTIDIHNNPGFNRVFAVFPERAEFQTTPIGGINFAYPGNDYDYCHIIQHIELQRVEPTKVGEVNQGRYPEQFQVTQSFPNPFSSHTELILQLTRPGPVTFEIYNVLGRQVAQPVDVNYPKGEHRLVWNGLADDLRPVPPGIYIEKVTVGGQTAVRKVLLLK